MGLDMYLSGKRYMTKIFNKEDEARMLAIQAQFPELAGRKGRWGDASPVKEVSIELGYWRKANHIHNWFVKNVQGGKDECQPHYVSREHLKELRSICEQVLENNELASTLLPTTPGFFFGGTDYDEYYFEECRDTIEFIDSAMELPTSWDFEYRSSW